MKVAVTNLFVALPAIAIVSIAIVAPLTSWITNPQAITEYAVQILMLICAFIGSVFITTIACACKGKF